MKICKSCKYEKPLTEFHIAQKSGKVGTDGYVRKTTCYKSKCKDCLREEQRKKYHELEDNVKIKRRKNNPCNTFEWRRQYRLKSRFGLTTEEFSAMVLEQNNKCKICDCEMETPQIDHNHTTGEVRSLLCRPCNTSLGMVKEDTKILYNMISYINAYL